MSIFRLVEFEINNRSLNKLENNALAPLCHILHLLNYDDTDQGTFLPLQGWAKDTGMYDSVDMGGDNEGYTAYYNGVRQSRTVYYEVPLKQFPFLALDKPIPPKTKIKLAFRLAETALCLQGDAGAGEAVTAKMRLTDIKLNVDNLIMDPSFEARLNTLMVSNSNVVNDIDTWDVRVIQIPGGSVNAEIVNVFQGLLPKRIVFYIQSAARLDGTIELNQFRIQRESLQKITITGSLGTMELDISDGKELKAYKTVIKGREMHGRGCTLTLGDWRANNCFYILDFTPHGDYYDTVRSIDTAGNLDFKFTFTNAPNALKAVFMGQKNNTVMMDSTQSVLSEN